ncbi:hypothetical protein PR202_ga13001 [Eleusine coracana subsp. coracana]|uniref:Uncharacterized protein n=1 Tax=Eleusine coracana subsp. coracana TaxID=191504 RepID=A0AAV5CDS1_ELECO|nr:hypothetical protein PR202_ga13001 [Eleusine coracana subsp. coracana]
MPSALLLSEFCLGRCAWLNHIASSSASSIVHGCGITVVPLAQDKTHNKLKDKKAELKKCGDKAAKAKDYVGALKFYTENSARVKGYYRKGAALMSLKEYEEAYDVFMDALEMDPGNAEIKKAMWEANAAMGDGDVSDESQ